MKTLEQIKKLNNLESYTSNVVSSAAEHLASMLAECDVNVDDVLAYKHAAIMESIRDFKIEIQKLKRQ